MDLHAIADLFGARLVDLETELPHDGTLRRWAMPLFRYVSRRARKAGRDRQSFVGAILRELAMRLEDIPSHDEELAYHRNSASISGQDGATIVLGPFDDAHCRLAAFFHEIGHLSDGRQDRVIDDKELRYEGEFRAWVAGLELATVEGVRFDDKTLGWCDEQLATYIGWEQREVRGWAEVEPPRDPHVLVKAYGRESGWAPEQRSQG